MTDPSSPNPASWPPPPSDPTPVPSAPLTPQAPAAPYPPAYPASAPYPASAAPYPASAAPYPASAAPYPASAAPYSAAPYGFAPPPAPKKNAWVIVLSILSGVLFLAGGGVGALYYLDHDKATKAAAEQRTQVDDLRGQLDQAQADLDGLEEDYADLEAEAERCTDAVGELLNATPAEGATEEELARQISALVFDLIQACDVSVNAP